MSLTKYNQKRNFEQTKEPKGKTNKQKGFRFVVQKHQASHLHYDFRLELGGVLVSWAVPKGPSMNPSDKRLAVHVEDHPVSYINFHGTIPKGNYGAGTVEIWDKGTFIPVDEKHKAITERKAITNIKNGEIKFLIKGKKLRGEFVLVKLKNDEKNWLMIKHKDEYSGKTIANEEVSSVANIRFGEGKKFQHFIKPMLAGISKNSFDDKDWIFEIKWDGYRAVAEIKKETRMYSRNGLDFSQRFPSIYKALGTIKHNCVIDGEIVLLNEKNVPDFQKLQHYETNLQYPIVYYVFDLLELDGKSTLSLPLIDRKKLLKKLLPKTKNSIIRYCDHVDTEGNSFLAKAKEMGLEGIIAKLKSGEYKKGLRSKEWLKIKNIQTTEVVIAGYTEPRGGRKHFGSLILASKKGNKWQFRGHAGTGFSNETLSELKKIMKPYIIDDSPFDTKVDINDTPTWLKPELVADIAYTEVTKDGLFRHPVFLRLRDEKKAAEVNDESDVQQTAAPGFIKAGTHKVPVTNLQKVYWPDEGYTKGELLEYYQQISSYILPYLKDRPLSLNRMPNGIAGQSFYHKDAGENVPSFVDTFKVKSGEGKTIDYIVCNNLATLIYAANLGSIEMNPWNSTTKKPDNPTWMVIDIDPSPKNKFTEVVDVALVTKQILDKAGIESYCKTSGATGLHVYAPMKNKYDYEHVKNFAHLVATLVQEQLPKTTTLERSLSKRGPHIYIDYLQNRQGQTLASAYSMRPKPGATVSTPLEWKEVNHKLLPEAFTIETIFKRLENKGDLFKGVLTGSNNLWQALKKLKV